MLAHLLPLLGFLIPGMNIVVPLLIWLTKRNESAFLDHHGREALNFQISLTLLAAIWLALKMIIVGTAFSTPCASGGYPGIDVNDSCWPEG